MSDVDPDRPRDVDARPPWSVLGAIAAGGVIGAEGRYGLSLAFPHPAGSWPWATLVTNVVGCLLMGSLMVVLLERMTPHRLARPFLGVGVLGGFTTFSTFALDVDTLVHAHRVGLAAGYVGASLAGCLLAVAAGGALARTLGRRA